MKHAFLMPLRGHIIFSVLFATTSMPTLAPIQPCIQWVLGAFSQGAKWLECEAILSYLLVGNRKLETSTPHLICLHLLADCA